MSKIKVSRDGTTFEFTTVDGVECIVHMDDMVSPMYNPAKNVTHFESKGWGHNVSGRELYDAYRKAMGLTTNERDGGK